MEIKGNVFVVTGGGSGLGAATARMIVAAGGKAVLADVNKEAGGPNLNFYVGVDNVLDRMPPLGSTATGAGSAIYNFRGRNFYAGARARF